MALRQRNQEPFGMVQVTVVRYASIALPETKSHTHTTMRREYYDIGQDERSIIVESGIRLYGT
jgi:hypothetical protein